MLEKKVNQKRDCRVVRRSAMTNGKAGSALIMTVVLTVLLSIVAVMFVMVARMDSASTSNIVDSKTLDNAAKSIIEIIGKELVLDTPGVASQEYQDYPDVNDAWLANIEPYEDSGTYYWRQISDVTGFLKDRTFQTRDVLVRPSGSTVVKDYPKIEIVETTGLLEDTTDNANADADGDGIADSKWIELDGLNTSKGKKVFAAIRIIDNCAMVNVNTAYKFDGTSNDRFRVDGTSQLQINLEGLLKTSGNDNIDAFHKARCGGDSALYVDDSTGWNKYDRNVIWDYNVPGGNYLPFDISDELELRYRYCIDSRFVSRIETDANITATIRGRGNPDFGNLYDGSTNWGLPAWKPQITDPNNDYADRRHLLTTYSFDRIIDPAGEKMRSVYSSEGAQYLYERLADCIDANHLADGETENDLHAYLAQFAANVVDRSDNDANVSIVKDENGKDFYGDEKPYIYISEITRNFSKSSDPLDANVYRSYAVELFKEYEKDANEAFDDWQLIISNSNPAQVIYIDSNDFKSRGGKFYVKLFDGNAPGVNISLQDDVKYTNTPEDGATGIDPAVILRWDPFFMGYEPNGTDPNKYDPVMSGNYDFYFGLTNPPAFVGNQTDTMYNPGGLESEKEYFWQVVGKKDGFEDVEGSVRSFTTWKDKPEDVDNVEPNAFSDNPFKISLWRPTMNGHASILADEVNLPGWLTDFNVGGGGKRTFQRDLRPGYRIKRIWDRDSSSVLRLTPTLGRTNTNWSIFDNPIQLWHHNFTNVGDAAMLFAKKTVYLQGLNQMGSASLAFTGTESDVRFDINSPSMQNVFKYITALNPRERSTSNDVNETRVRGRININTAPAFVIAQLPWVSRVNRQDLKIADAIVAYRDMSQLKASDGSIVLDYTDRSDSGKATGITNIYESPGFRSVGELLSVINKSSGKDEYNIRYCGMDNGQQYGFPDLTFYSESMDDGVKNDLEEQELIFARISDLATVRSDTFTAYILVRVGVDGPQKRFIAILDRSGVNDATDKVKVAAFQQVPAAR